MHTIEPYFKWRDLYIASEDTASPFYGTTYDEFSFTKKIYNYFIHPQWDEFGSSTLYLKVLFVDYDTKYAIIELIGEWNDCIHNDIMFLKRDVIDALTKQDIKHFILVCDNVLNFHGSDDCYYEEWYEDIRDDGGWITCINTFDHVLQEMEMEGLQYYINVGIQYNDVAWRGKQPKHLFQEVHSRLHGGVQQLRN